MTPTVWFAIAWICVGALGGLALLALLLWVDRRWKACMHALTLGYRTTPRHGLAPTTDRASMQPVVTRRFYGGTPINADERSWPTTWPSTPSDLRSARRACRKP